MPVPTHAWDCQTVCFPINCPDCRDRVYYLACSCGSKVLFDSPGPPWPQHGDRCIPYQVRLLQAQGRTREQIRTLVTSHAAQDGLTISPQVMSQLGFSVKTPLATDEPFPAVVVALNEVNIFKRLGFQDNAVGRQLLGALAEDQLVELVVQPVDDVRETSIEAFASTKQIPTGVSVGSSVLLNLAKHEVVGGKSVVMVKEIQVFSN